MYLPLEIQQKRRHALQRAAVQRVLGMPIKPTTSMGFQAGPGIHVPLGCPVHHANLRPGTPAHWRLTRLQTHLATIYKEVPQEYRYSTSILRMLGIRQQISAPALPRDLLWKAYITSQTAGHEIRRQKYKHLRRSNDRRHLGTGVDLRQGLRFLEHDEKCDPIRSRLHFERLMDAYRFKLETDKIGVGPPEQEALHRLSRGEIAIRKIFISKRCQALREAGYDPELLLLRQAPLPDAT